MTTNDARLASARTKEHETEEDLRPPNLATWEHRVLRVRPVAPPASKKKEPKQRGASPPKGLGGGGGFFVFPATIGIW